MRAEAISDFLRAEVDVFAAVLAPGCNDARSPTIIFLFMRVCGLINHIILSLNRRVLALILEILFHLQLIRKHRFIFLFLFILLVINNLLRHSFLVASKLFGLEIEQYRFVFDHL